MARKNLNVETEMSPFELASQYINLKAEEKNVGDKLKPLNAKLKEYFKNGSDSSIDTDEGSVVISYREKPVFDDAAIIERFRGYSFVKTKEYVDFDILESALYHGEVNADDINEFKTIKRTAVLNIKKAR